MALTNFDDEKFESGGFPDETPPEPEKKPGNRTFLIVIAVLGVIFLLALLLLLVFAPKYLSQQRAEQQEQAALINAANTATALAGTSVVNQQVTQAAQTSIARTPTVGPTKTAVVVVATKTPVVQELSAAELATVSALQTQMAGGGAAGTAAAATATQLPETGFADEFGLPMMAGMALVLVLIIILSRKLRLSSR